MEENKSPEQTTAPKTEPTLGRNEPCPCGSGKKYKRCHGVDAAPKLSTPKQAPEGVPSAAGGANGAFAPGGAFDPSKMDPAWMQQFSKAMQRMPKGQLQRLQGIMQKAMAGKDVSREAGDFEKLLTPEMQELVRGFQMQNMGAMGGGNPEEGMSEEEARAIVAKAASEGKVSEEKAQDLLGAESATKSVGGVGKFWRSLKGK